MTRPTRAIVVSFFALLLAGLTGQGYGVVANAILAIALISFPAILFYMSAYRKGIFKEDTK